METRSWSSKVLGVLISVITAESVELGQVVRTQPPERLPWEHEGPHLLIYFKRHQKSTKGAEFLNFWMLVSYYFKYKVRPKKICGLNSGLFTLICFFYIHLCHAQSASWSFLLWKVKNRSDKLLLVADRDSPGNQVKCPRFPRARLLVSSLCFFISSDEAPLRVLQPLRC